MKLQDEFFLNFFSDYVKLDLSNGPSPFLDLFASFEKEPGYFHINRHIKYMMFFSDINDPQKALNAIQEKVNERCDQVGNGLGLDSHKATVKQEIECAYNDVYAYQNCKCLCYTHFIFNVKTWDVKEQIMNTENRSLQCYECTQAAFKYLLSMIVEGVEYSVINSKIGFKAILADGIQALKKVYKFSENDNSRKHFKESISTTHILNFSPFPYDSSQGGHMHGFNRFILSLAGHSLGEFLSSNNDRRKLKLCEYCQRFFIANDIRRVKCRDDECKRKYEREKKRKQRENDPATYY